jgi:glycogen debranching enzyme
MAFRTGSGLAFLFLVAIAHPAQPPTFNSVPAFPLESSGPVIRAHTESEKPFTVAGEHGVVLGQQNGIFEAWVLPVKLLSHLTIEANIEGYTVPIDVNRQAAEIEVRPDRTVITYSHIGFTVRQIVFSADDVSVGTSPQRQGPVAGDPGTGPIVLYEFDCLHPTEFIFRFTPELQWMWPERNQGVPGVEWVAGPSATPAAKELGPSSPLPAHGYYVLHTDYPDLAGAVTIPGAQPGILAPFQERPQVHPVELRVHIDPARDHGRLFPLLMAAGMNKEAATSAALGVTLAKLNESIAALYRAHDESYKKLLADSVSIETPDKTLDEAFQWAVVSIEQLKAKALPGNETALVAGYYASGDSARPGFGWFFGRDALYTLYAVNGYGDFALSKAQLEFLIKRQREDGKIMHEYSQTAAFVDWRQFPYMYAAADSTPLFLMAMADYVRASGDVAFLAAHRDAIEKAWAFETHPAHDTDQDGIYNNSQGTGWVESWPGGMPHQEIYLALLDQQASAAMAYIEGQLKDEKASRAAQARAERLAKTINAEYWDPQKNCYAFSRNADGSLDRTSTVYPALAWWDPPGGKSILAQPEGCLSQFAGAALNTDWGLRDVANTEPIYDGMSYHQGSVWPLFTGWAALAQYRGGQPLAGYQILTENANLTRAQDLGAVTELLSGDFFVPFGRSTSHQLWSSAMVITPTLRGLFGISIDAQTKTITVNPHLPAGWNSAKVKHLHLTDGETTVYVSRAADHYNIALDMPAPKGWKIRSDLPGAHTSTDVNGEVTLHAPLPVIEVDQLFPRVTTKLRDITPVLDQAPLPGDATSRFRILREDYSDHKLVLIIEGLSGSRGGVGLVRHAMIVPHPQLQMKGSEAGISFSEAALRDPDVPMLLYFHFSEGEGWKTITVTLTW